MNFDDLIGTYEPNEHEKELLRHIIGGLMKTLFQSSSHLGHEFYHLASELGIDLHNCDRRFFDHVAKHLRPKE